MAKEKSGEPIVVLSYMDSPCFASGSQYAGRDYQALLQAHEFQCSMSRKGNCWDNAVVERFLGTLKREWTHARNFRTRPEAKAAVIEYIEIFDNSHRRHSTLGYLSPNEFEAQARGG